MQLSSMSHFALVFLGFMGDFFILLAFFLLQAGKTEPRAALYLALNLIGAVGIMLSLIAEFNWPVLFIELFWIVISFYGIYKAISLKFKPSFKTL